MSVQKLESSVLKICSCFQGDEGNDDHLKEEIPYLGAALMMSSTLRIISAASVAEINACLLHLNDSVIPKSTISAMRPLSISENDKKQF